MTERAEIETRVKKVLAEQLAVDEAQVVPDARFAGGPERRLCSTSWRPCSRSKRSGASRSPRMRWSR